ncbi:MAG: acyl-CoA dehydrogenase family protein [Alphaproteobacteria bacterium]
MSTNQVEARPRRVAIPQPEPGLTPDEVVKRAAAIRPLLRSQQDESDKRGYYSPEAHEAMKKAGLYRVCQPKMWGGYEFDFSTLLRCSIEISRGQPGAGWCYTLGTSHAIVASSYLSPQAQAEIFTGDGDFRAPHKAIPTGKFERADGGYIVNGTWTYSSGIPYATHAFCGATIASNDGSPPRWGHFIVARDKVTMLNDWGGDYSLGMQSSGSNSVKVENVFVPDRHFFFDDMLFSSKSDGSGTYGTELHGNPMYIAVVGGIYHATFGAIMTGTARAALDEYEDIMRKRTVPNTPVLRINDPESQRIIGKAIQLTDSAEALTIACGNRYKEQCDRWARDKTPISAEDTLRLWGMAQEACFMANEATEMLFKTAGSSATNPGQKMGRYFRDIQMYITHPSSQTRIPSMIAQNYLGIGSTPFSERGQTDRGPKKS